MVNDQEVQDDLTIMKQAAMGVLYRSLKASTAAQQLLHMLMMNSVTTKEYNKLIDEIHADLARALQELLNVKLEAKDG